MRRRQAEPVSVRENAIDGTIDVGSGKNGAATLEKPDFLEHHGEVVGIAKALEMDESFIKRNIQTFGDAFARPNDREREHLRRNDLARGLKDAGRALNVRHIARKG